MQTTKTHHNRNLDYQAPLINRYLVGIVSLHMKNILLLLALTLLTACSTPQPPKPPTAEIPLQKPVTPIPPAPIQTEVQSEVPALNREGNLYGLGPWLNSEPIGSLEDLKGRVVLVKFWTFACVNCIHTLPHVQNWHEKYADEGLSILGIHSPEFAYERKLENVQASAEEYGLTFPIALDNDFKTWRSFNNRYWPAFYLLDTHGNVVYKHFGQGDYEATEQKIQALLKTVSPEFKEVENTVIEKTILTPNPSPKVEAPTRL